MNIADVLLLLIRWLHALAAVAWVGGGMFYLLVLRPALRRSEDGGPDSLARVGEQFRSLVSTAISVLVVTGVVLTLARLTSEHGGLPYLVVLGTKVGLALYMFYLARFFRRRRYPIEDEPTAGPLRRLSAVATGATMVLVLGVIVFLLADVLTALVEHELKE